MGTDHREIPAQTYKRLPGYYNYLALLHERGVDSVSSPVIARALNLTDIQVRKDLACVAASGGKPRTGYKTQELIASIGRTLGYYSTSDAVLVGAGRLGSALLAYEGFREYGFRIVAAFDADERLVGTVISGKPVLTMADMEFYCRKARVRTGVIAVPARQAQQVCDALVRSGVLAVWNFAPVHLVTPESVFVLNENMAVSVALLTQHLSKASADGRQAATE